MDNFSQSQNQENDPMIGKLIFDRYKLIKKLGAGSFGSIYSAEYENKYYAVKLEEKREGFSLLEQESYIMSHLRSPALPNVKIFGYSSFHNILVMELMGKSLEDIFENYHPKKFSVRCVCNIGYQIIEILEFIHNKHIIHRDIKPDNFVIGLNEKKKYIYILDFGLAKKYRSSKTLKHYTMIKNKNLTGTARYASINALNGFTQSRRDDLEAVGYVLMYFLRGRLPWQGIPIKNKEERYRRIMETKRDTKIEDLCNGFPHQFAEYIKYTRSLEYETDPNYNYLKNLFASALNSIGHTIDCYYDWDRDTIHYNRNFNVHETNDSTSKSSVNSKYLFNQAKTESSNNEENNKKKFPNEGKINRFTNNKDISTINNITNNKINGSNANNDYSAINTTPNTQEMTNNIPNNNQKISENNQNNSSSEKNINNNDNNEYINLEKKDNPTKSKLEKEDKKCCIIF